MAFSRPDGIRLPDRSSNKEARGHVLKLTCSEVASCVDGFQYPLGKDANTAGRLAITKGVIHRAKAQLFSRYTLDKDLIDWVESSKMSAFSPLGLLPAEP